MFIARFHFVLIGIILIASLGIGCSDGGANPVTPTGSDTTQTANTEDTSSRMLWGFWDLYFDPSEMEVTAVPVRESAIHADVTDFLLPPNCDDCVVIAVNSFDPVTRILDADVTLRNPTPLTGYDVRGILFTNQYGHLLTNADAWTQLWDVPNGLAINPFLAFAKDIDRRMFAGGAEHTENFLVYIPVPPQYWAIQFAVDASWPGNCKEPYAIEDFTQLGILYEYTGATVELQVDVHDWLNNVRDVIIWAQQITDETNTPFSHITGNTWGVTIANASGLGAGEYEASLTVNSFDSSDILFHKPKITITETPAPTVEAINPSISAADTSLTDVEITGTNFLGDCTAKLVMSGEPEIAATNVVVTDVTTLVCDIDIPLGATLGLYDVEVTNGGDLSGTGTEMFEVAEQGPYFPVDITPPWLNFAPYGLCVSGSYVYVAGYMTGLHVFDITDPSKPEWVGKTDIDGDAWGVTVSGNYAYITGRYSGFFVVDITTPNAPEPVGYVDTGRAMDVSVAGDYAFVADWTSGLTIIDISVPDAPSVVNTVDTDGNAQGVFVDAGYAYVGDGDSGLQIIKIDPVETAAVVKTVDTDGAAEGVLVSDGYAYIADYGAGLQVIDVDPINTASVVQTVDTPGNARRVALGVDCVYIADHYGGFQVIDIDTPETAFILHDIGTISDAESVCTKGDYAYVAGHFTGLYAIDVSIPSSAAIASTTYTPGYAGGVAYENGYAYVAANNPGVMILDIDPLPDAHVALLVPTAEAWAITIKGDYAFVADWNSGHLRIIDKSVVESAFVLGAVNTLGITCDVAVEGEYAYTAERTMGLSISDIDPPGSASLVINVPTTDKAEGVAVDGGYAYVADEDDGLHIVDVDPVGSAYIYNTVAITGQSIGVVISGDYAYVAAKAGDLAIVDINPPDTASVVKTVALPEIAHDVYVSGDFAYVVCDTAGLVVVDINPVGDAHIVAECDTPGIAADVFVEDNYAYVADQWAGLRIIELW